MNGSIKYWKKQAKMNLSGHWGSAIAGVLAVGAVTFVGNILSIQLFPEYTLANGGRTGLCICLFTDCHGLSHRVQLHASEYGS